MNEVTIADPSALTVHPAAALFPMLDDDELRELAEDIRVHGLASSIVVLGNMLLDGRNRLRACEIAGVPPRFVEWTGTGSITSWIFSVNLHRRHLSVSQRALLAARAVEVFAVEAKARMEGGVEVAPEERARSREKAADQFHVAHGTVYHAQTVISRGAPELVAAVEAGEVAVSTAAELATLPVDEQRAVVREKKTAEKAKEVRERRRPPSPPKPEPKAVTSPPTAIDPPPVPAPSAPASLDESELLADEGDDEESTLDPRNKPELQPLPLTAFKAGYRRGSNPAEEAEKVDQILAAARSALYAWRWIVIEWNEDKRWDMKFAIHESGQVAMHLNQAVTKLEEISAICNGRKPAPPSEGP